MKLASIAERKQFRKCKFAKIFTPLQAHGMEKITAWRSGKFSLATQIYRAIFDKIVCSNIFLQNKQKANGHWSFTQIMV
jgi:hypothetical protein